MSGSAVRMRRLRMRQRNGMMILRLPVHEQGTSAALVDSGFLAERHADDRIEIEKAAARAWDTMIQRLVIR